MLDNNLAINAKNLRFNAKFPHVKNMQNVTYIYKRIPSCWYHHLWITDDLIESFNRFSGNGAY